MRDELMMDEDKIAMWTTQVVADHIIVSPYFGDWQMILDVRASTPRRRREKQGPCCPVMMAMVDS